MRSLGTIAAALICLTAIPAAAQDDKAPFGLTWLTSSQEIEALGISLTPTDMGTFGTSFTASNLPKALSDLDFVVLSFGYDDRLWRVAALGEENDNDQYGSRIRARYDEIAASLAKSYTLVDTAERQSSDSYYGKSENFAYSLSQNETWWYSTFRSPSADIELSIDSNHEDTFWRLIYTNSAGEKAFEGSKADAELDAL